MREIDDHTIGAGEPGEVTRALQRLFEDALHGRAEQYREWLDFVEVPAAAPTGERGVAAVRPSCGRRITRAA